MPTKPRRRHAALAGERRRQSTLRRRASGRSGERYGVGNANYYRVMRSEVTGTKPGDSVKVWFTGGGATSDSFTYQAVE